MSSSPQPSSVHVDESQEMDIDDGHLDQSNQQRNTDQPAMSQIPNPPQMPELDQVNINRIHENQDQVAEQNNNGQNFLQLRQPEQQQEQNEDQQQFVLYQQAVVQHLQLQQQVVHHQRPRQPGDEQRQSQPEPNVSNGGQSEPQDDVEYVGCVRRGVNMNMNVFPNPMYSYNYINRTQRGRPSVIQYSSNPSPRVPSATQGTSYQHQHINHPPPPPPPYPGYNHCSSPQASMGQGQGFNTGHGHGHGSMLGQQYRTVFPDGSTPRHPYSQFHPEIRPQLQPSSSPFRFPTPHTSQFQQHHQQPVYHPYQQPQPHPFDQNAYTRAQYNYGQGQSQQHAIQNQPPMGTFLYQNSNGSPPRQYFQQQIPVSAEMHGYNYLQNGPQQPSDSHLQQGMNFQNVRGQVPETRPGVIYHFNGGGHIPGPNRGSNLVQSGAGPGSSQGLPQMASFLQNGHGPSPSLALPHGSNYIQNGRGPAPAPDPNVNVEWHESGRRQTRRSNHQSVRPEFESSPSVTPRPMTPGRHPLVYLQELSHRASNFYPQNNTGVPQGQGQRFSAQPTTRPYSPHLQALLISPTRHMIPQQSSMSPTDHMYSQNPEREHSRKPRRSRKQSFDADTNTNTNTNNTTTKFLLLAPRLPAVSVSSPTVAASSSGLSPNVARSSVKSRPLILSTPRTSTAPTSFAAGSSADQHNTPIDLLPLFRWDPKTCTFVVAKKSTIKQELPSPISPLSPPMGFNPMDFVKVEHDAELWIDNEVRTKPKRTYNRKPVDPSKPKTPRKSRKRGAGADLEGEPQYKLTHIDPSLANCGGTYLAQDLSKRNSIIRLPVTSTTDLVSEAFVRSGILNKTPEVHSNNSSAELEPPSALPIEKKQDNSPPKIIDYATMSNSRPNPIDMLKSFRYLPPGLGGSGTIPVEPESDRSPSPPVITHSPPESSNQSQGQRQSSRNTRGLPAMVPMPVRSSPRKSPEKRTSNMERTSRLDELRQNVRTFYASEPTPTENDIASAMLTLGRDVYTNQNVESNTQKEQKSSEVVNVTPGVNSEASSSVNTDRDDANANQTACSAADLEELDHEEVIDPALTRIVPDGELLSAVEFLVTTVADNNGTESDTPEQFDSTHTTGGHSDNTNTLRFEYNDESESVTSNDDHDFKLKVVEDEGVCNTALSDESSTMSCNGDEQRPIDEEEESQMTNFNDLIRPTSPIEESSIADSPNVPSPSTGVQNSSDADADADAVTVEIIIMDD